MSTLAASSRPFLVPVKSGLSRTVVHHARPPRIPVLPGPHNPKLPRPTSGTSQPHPGYRSADSASSTSLHSLSSSSGYPTPPYTSLEGTRLTFHHAPPPSAPSYTTGAKPDLLRWLSGGSVRLTGEEGAPRRRERRVGGGEEVPGWGQEEVQRMRELRSKGLSRKEIALSLSLPLSQTSLIPRAAPLTRPQRAELEAEAEKKKETWGYRKRFAAAARERRKGFW